MYRTPLTFLTASGASPDRAQMSEMGAVDYIRKPCDKHELLERVGKMIGG